MRVAGIVLCGGRSSRMGRPKAWLPLGEEVLLQRVTRILGAVVSPVVVVAAPEQEVPPLPDSITIIRDEIEGRGPLGGLAAGLQALRDSADAAYLSACDVPFLHEHFIQRMIELFAVSGCSIAVPRVEGYFHPLAGVYRVDLCDTVLSLLAADRLRPVFLFDEAKTRIVEKDELNDVDPTLESLRNVNTPDEYEAILRDWQRKQG